MTHVRILSLATLVLLMGAGGCTKNNQKSDKGVFFVEPKDGETVISTFKVRFGVRGMTVRPALEDVNGKTSGHHHILVDNEKGFIEAGQVIPKDMNNIHYGKGETETVLTLTPGKHKLSLQFADGAHLSYGQEMSTSITVNVEAPKAEL